MYNSRHKSCTDATSVCQFTSISNCAIHTQWGVLVATVNLSSGRSRKTQKYIHDDKKLTKQTASEGRHQSTCSDDHVETQRAQCQDRLTAASSESEPTHCLEATDDNLMWALQKHYYKVIYNVHPKADTNYTLVHTAIDQLSKYFHWHTQQ